MKCEKILLRLKRKDGKQLSTLSFDMLQVHLSVCFLCYVSDSVFLEGVVEMQKNLSVGSVMPSCGVLSRHWVIDLKAKEMLHSGHL